MSQGVRYSKRKPAYPRRNPAYGATSSYFSPKYSRYGAGRPRGPIYRSLIGARTHTFRVNAQPFHIGMTPGTSGNFGCSFFQDQTIPLTGSLSGTGSNNFTLSYTLGGVLVWFGSGPSSALVPLANAAEYTALFDSYRIKAVEITMYSSQNSNQSTVQFLPNVGCCTDYDDASPIPWTEAAQYENFRVINFAVPNKKVIRCSPVASLSVANTGGVFVPSSASRRTWMDCAQNNIQYYGNKFCFDNPMTGVAAPLQNEGWVTFHVRYTIEFKGTR